MKRIIDYRSFLETDEAHVGQLLTEWKPNAFNLTEKEQEQALLAWLQKRLPGVPIVAQYGIAKGKADIVIEDTHVIELKLGFDETSVAEFDRCLGQLERYKQKWVKKDRGSVYLVVVGQSDAEFGDLLYTWFKETNGSFFGSWFYLINKQPNYP